MVTGVRQFPLAAAGSADSGSHFLWGPENQLVDVLLVRLFATGAKPGWNCFTVCGSSGTGKSLLLHKIARSWNESHQQPATLTTGADWARTVNWAHRTSRNPKKNTTSGLNDATGGLVAWRDECRQTSLFLLDDVDSLRRYPLAQRELVLLLDDLQSIQIPVVVSGRVPPSVADLEPQLQSRLTGQIVIPLVVPGSATRRRFLQLVTGRQRCVLEPAAIEWLAQHLRGSFLEIQSQVAHRLHANGLPNQGEILDKRDAIRLFDRPETSSSQCMHQICQVVAGFYKVSVSELKSKSRKRALVRARNVVCHVAREYYRLSHYEIAKCLGNRDHSTIIHACKQLTKTLSTESELNETVEEIVVVLKRRFARTPMFESSG